MPTQRTIEKFARDLGLAVAAVAAGFVVENAASLNLGSTETAALVAVAGFVYRLVRGLMGREPNA